MKFLSIVGLLALSSALPSTTATPSSSKHHPLPVDYQSFTPLQPAAVQAPTEGEYQSLFTDFVKRHNKEYATHEKSRKYNVFKENAEKIRLHNIHHRAGHHTYSLALNEHADMTWSEFRGQFLGYNHHAGHKTYRSNNAAQFTPEQYWQAGNLTEVDWVKKGVVSGVKNQGQCGSCWAFSATGSLEAVHAIATGALVELSEQELVDCSTTEGNNGCNGGLMDYAFQFVIDNKGICTEQSYSYEATGPNQCVAGCELAATISSFKDIAEGDEEALKVAVTTVGPVSIAIEADQEAFQFYSAGVFDAECGTQLDHGVLVTGFGTDATTGKDFWDVKNSWGESWGQNGYIKLVRGQNQCGIASAASYPVV